MNESLGEIISLSFDTFEKLSNNEIAKITNKLKNDSMKLISNEFNDFLSKDINISSNSILKLLLSREIFLDILESFPQGIQIVDDDGLIIYVNPEFLNEVNVKIDERIGKNIFDVSPDGSLSKVLKTKEPVTNLMNFPKGTQVGIVSSAFPICYQDKMIGAIAVMNNVKSVFDLTVNLKKSRHLLKNLSEQITQISTAKFSFKDIISNDIKMKSSIEMCQVAAQSDSIVLIQGETGTGKELFANAIHDASARSKGPFITVNCSAIPKSLLESEFFGHEKGAFTGAYMRKLGKFELANKGTLFLDEIGELDLELQPKLLRAIQEREIQRVGGEDKIRLDVRIISATNRNLEQMIEKGEFRRDLYYRLNVWKVTIPPLRERKEDIELLANYLLNVIIAS
jgi:transcriptional regulator with PAS, ATPase and Fis domain